METAAELKPVSFQFLPSKRNSNHWWIEGCGIHFITENERFQGWLGSWKV